MNTAKPIVLVAAVLAAAVVPACDGSGSEASDASFGALSDGSAGEEASAGGAGGFAAAEEAGLDGASGQPTGGAAGDSDAAATSSTVATVGPNGGSLSVDGVTVTIPAGALSSDVEITMTVGAEALVAISPDLFFEGPHVATVKMDGNRWPAGGPRIALHETLGEFYMIGDVLWNADGSWQYDTTAFSKNFTCLVGDKKCVSFDPDGGVPDPLTVCDWVNASGSCPPIDGGPQLFRERDYTYKPESVPRTYVTKRCLVDAADEIGNRHDPVTGPHAPGKKDPTRAADEYNWMTSEAKETLKKARIAVQQELPAYDIWVNGAWDSAGEGVHEPGTSNHYWGIALDLALCKQPCKFKADIDEATMGKLAPILIASGFTFVFYEDPGHIHTSVSLDKSTGGSLSFCCAVECVDPPHAKGKCEKNACQYTCEAGYVAVGGDAKNGCEPPCVESGPETCNGKDDDCNGVIDDPDEVGCVCIGGVCV